MTSTLERDTERRSSAAGLSIATGIVSNNVDLITEGKVQVRVPAHDCTVWARLVATGAGSDAGFFYVPRIDDQVLVAFAEDDPADAFLLGGLWSLRDRIPVTDPFTALTTRVIRSGVLPGQGQEIEFDDALQAVTITTFTGQKVRLDPEAIELTNIAGTVSIKMSNLTQSIAIKSLGSISLEAARIELKALASVTIDAGVSASVTSSGVTTVKGSLVTIN